MQSNRRRGVKKHPKLVVKENLKTTCFSESWLTSGICFNQQIYDFQKSWITDLPSFKAVILIPGFLNALGFFTCGNHPQTLQHY